jgi:hypothetical protein
MSVRLFYCLVLCAGVCSFAGNTAPEISHARQLLRDLPVRFEPNQGQWNPQVKFFARAGDSRLLLTSNEAVLSVGGQAVGLSLLHSNRSAQVAGLDPLPTRANYFLGADRNQWRTGVTQYSRVKYADVYPGIDLIYYGTANQLEYDLVLRPGADAGKIRLKFRGAGRPSVSPEGDLMLSAGDAHLLQKKPVIYQETVTGSRQIIEGRYKLLGSNVVGVELAAYDRARALTIDPVLIYSSLLGGGGSDAVIGVKIDRAGMVWVAGYTSTGDLNATGDAFQPKTGGGTNVFLAKINPKGDFSNSLVYFTYIGGSGVDMPNAMAMDANGYIYLAGSSTSIDFPLRGNVSQTGNAGGNDAFIMKFDPSATGTDQLFYAAQFGGTGEDGAFGIDVDAAGKIYVIGTTRSTDFPLTGSAYASVLYGPQDAFVVKFDLTTSPTMVYSTFLGGELADTGRAIAVTPSGTVYIAGSTESTQFPVAGAQYRGSLAGALDVWVGQMDLTQSGVNALVYTSYLGGGDLDEVRKIAIDSAGRLLVVGYTASTDFPVTAGAYQTTNGGNADAFVARLDFTRPQNGFVDYATYLGGLHGEVAYDVTSDAAGNIYVTGYTLSANFPVSPDGLVKSGGGGTDAFFAKLNPAVAGAGSLVYSSYLGNTGTHVGYGMAAAADGTVYVGGLTSIQDIFVSGNASQLNFGGGVSDGFLIAVAPGN